MKLLSPQQAYGDFVQMRRLDSRHFDDQGKIGQPLKEGQKNFGDVLLQAVDSVNQEQQTAAEMSQQMIVAPDSLDIHDVTIAMAKANMALSITKEVIDRGVRAYQDIINLR